MTYPEAHGHPRQLDARARHRKAPRRSRPPCGSGGEVSTTGRWMPAPGLPRSGRRGGAASPPGRPRSRRGSWRGGIDAHQVGLAEAPRWAWSRGEVREGTSDGDGDDLAFSLRQARRRRPGPRRRCAPASRWAGAAYAAPREERSPLRQVAPAHGTRSRTARRTPAPPPWARRSSSRCMTRSEWFTATKPSPGTSGSRTAGKRERRGAESERLARQERSRAGRGEGSGHVGQTRRGDQQRARRRDPCACTIADTSKAMPPPLLPGVRRGQPRTSPGWQAGVRGSTPPSSTSARQKEARRPRPLSGTLPSSRRTVATLDPISTLRTG